FPTPGGQGHVDGDAVQPGADGSVRLPSRPGAKSPQVRLLNAVLGGRVVTEHGRQRPVEPGISGLVQAVEVILRTWAIFGRAQELDSCKLQARLSGGLPKHFTYKGAGDT